MTRGRRSKGVLGRAVAALALLALAGCTATPAARNGADSLTFVVVRHAEKLDDSSDPPLSSAGQTRARRLAALLDDAPLAAIYSTDLQRTRQTVAPAAASHRLQVRLYDAREPAAAFAARLRATHASDTVLVAGHSNTVPAIVAALCSCEVSAMPETEFDRISTVRVDAQGRARLETSRY